MQNKLFTIALLLSPCLIGVSTAQDRSGFQFPARNLQEASAENNAAPNIGTYAQTRPTNSGVMQAGFQQPAPIQPAYQPTSQTVSTSSFPALTPNVEAKSDSSGSSSAGPVMTTAFSLIVVLGLFAGLVWVTRRFGNNSMTQGSVPSDVLRSLGSTTIDARTRVTMLRCGNRIIVMSQSAAGVQPLAEITDPAEVQRLTIACTGTGQANPQPTFAETLQQTRGNTRAGTNRAATSHTANRASA